MGRGRGPAPEAAGTILADTTGKRGVLVRYRMAGGPGLVFFLKDGVSCFNDSVVEQSHSPWLHGLAGEVLRSAPPRSGRYVRAGFTFSGGRLALSGVRRAKAGPDPRRFLFRFENECRYNYHHEDHSDAEANRVLRAAGLPPVFRSVRRPAGLFMRYEALERIEDAVKKKARGAAGLRRFRKALLGFMLTEARLAGEGRPLTARQLLARIKRINFRLAVFNYLHSRLLRYAGEFSGDPAWSGGRAAGGRARAGLRLPLKELQALKDTVNSRFAVINSAYAAGVARDAGVFAGADVLAACRLPAALLEKILSGKIQPPRAAAVKAPAEGWALPSEFPLTGRVVVDAEFSGKALLAAGGADAGRRHVLVADFPDESLLPQVRRAGALVTARGGPASPGAALARRLGKPCLADVPGCTRILRDGDRIVLRGGKIFRK